MFDYFIVLITVIAAVNFQFATWYYSPQEINTLQSVMRVSFYPLIPILILWLAKQFPFKSQKLRVFLVLWYWVWIAMMMVNTFLILIGMSTPIWTNPQYLLANFLTVSLIYLISSAVFVALVEVLILPQYYTEIAHRTMWLLISVANMVGIVTLIVFLRFCI